MVPSQSCFLTTVGCISALLSHPLVAAQRVQLLVDDHVIESRERLTRVVQQPKPHPQNPLIAAEHAWEGSVLEMPTVFWDPHLKLFRMYYWAVYNSETIYTCYATSHDAIHWIKPLLGLHKGPDGTTRNNIVLRGEGQVARTRYVVLNPDTTDRARRYLALYIDNVPGLTEFVASSPDGLHWKTEKKIGDLRNVRGGNVTKNPPFFLIEQQWGRDSQDGHRYRCIWRTESQDLLHWTGGRIVVDRRADDDPDLEFYHAAAHFIGTQSYHGIHFGYLYLFHTDTSRKVRDDGVRLAGTVATSLMYSRDTIHWTRADPKRRFLPLGGQGAWDAKMNYLMPEVPVRDTLHFYYCGFEKDHAFTRNKASLGLATLPRDRFVSLEAMQEPGWLVTKPFIADGDNLFLNADATGGQIRVSILDDRQKPLAKFGMDRAIALESDMLHSQVTWAGASFAELRGQTIRLRIHLQQARLFSFVIQ